MQTFDESLLKVHGESHGVSIGYNSFGIPQRKNFLKWDELGINNTFKTYSQLLIPTVTTWGATVSTMIIDNAKMAALILFFFSYLK